MRGRDLVMKSMKQSLPLRNDHVLIVASVSDDGATQQRVGDTGTRRVAGARVRARSCQQPVEKKRAAVSYRYGWSSGPAAVHAIETESKESGSSPARPRRSVAAGLAASTPSACSDGVRRPKSAGGSAGRWGRMALQRAATISRALRRDE